jgi:hypothetical protein
MNPILSHALIGLTTLVIGTCVGYSIREQGKFNSQVILNFGVAIVTMLALVGLLVSINQYRDATTCQSAYNINFTEALKERGSAADDDRHALRVALDAILDPKSDVAKRTQALKDWQTLVNSADDKRDANPIPITPECAKDIS